MPQNQYISTINTDDDGAVVMSSNQQNVNIELGQASNVGHSTYIRSTYAARYNFAVKQYNQYDSDGTNRKRSMRGGRFFLFNLIIIVLLVASVICYFNISNQKGLGAVPIVVSILYLLITFYNWYIHRRNGSLFHDHMFKVEDRYLSNSINEHFRIPVHARIQNRQLIAASDGNTTAALLRLQQQNHDLPSINVMLYGRTYANKYACFPAETIAHFLLFTVMIIISISLMSKNEYN